MKFDDIRVGDVFDCYGIVTHKCRLNNIVSFVGKDGRTRHYTTHSPDPIYHYDRVELRGVNDSEVQS
jgi:hypothetical protein